MMAFDLISDTLLHEPLLSLLDNKHIYSLKMEDERLVLTPPYLLKVASYSFWTERELISKISRWQELSNFTPKSRA